MNQEQTKERIIELLTETHRQDFFMAPASTKHHGAHIGGLYAIAALRLRARIKIKR